MSDKEEVLNYLEHAEVNIDDAFNTLLDMVDDAPEDEEQHDYIQEAIDRLTEIAEKIKEVAALVNEI